MLERSPVPEEVARWLLSQEAEQNESAAAIVAERVHRRLRAGLGVFLGPVGFDSLWARALSIAPPLRAGDGDEQDAAQMLRASNWPTALDGYSASEAHDVVLVAITSFIALLFTFIGAELGRRLIDQIWSEPPSHGSHTSSGEATV